MSMKQLKKDKEYLEEVDNIARKACNLIVFDGVKPVDLGSKNFKSVISMNYEKLKSISSRFDTVWVLKRGDDKYDGTYILVPTKNWKIVMKLESFLKKIGVYIDFCSIVKEDLYFSVPGKLWYSGWPENLFEVVINNKDPDFVRDNIVQFLKKKKKYLILPE